MQAGEEVVIRPSAARLFATLAPVLTVAAVLLVVRLAQSVAAGNLGAAAAAFVPAAVLLVAALLAVLALVNSRVFVTAGGFGRRTVLGRVRSWPRGDLAEVRFQTVNYGSRPVLAYRFISRDRRVLLQLAPAGWRREDIVRVLAALGVEARALPPVSIAEFRREFPAAR